MEATQMENVDKQLDITFVLTSALHVKDVIIAFQNFESFFNSLDFRIQIFWYYEKKMHYIFICRYNFANALTYLTKGMVRDLKLAKGF